MGGAIVTAPGATWFPVDRARLVVQCEDGCVLGDIDHDCCADEHDACDGQGCGECWGGLLWIL